MKGGIYTNQKCKPCDARFVDDHRRQGLYCPKCKKNAATSFYISFPISKNRKLKKRFKSYAAAEQALQHLRYQVSQNEFDEREWRSDKPLAFNKLADQWLDVKKKTVKETTYNDHKNCMFRAMDEWGDRNIKTVGYAEIEDFLLGQKRQDGKPLSEKSRANFRSTLNSFWQWLRKRQVLRPDQIPDIPHISFELKFKKTLSKADQQRVLDEIYRLFFHKNPKIWLALKWLMTYISVRPGELLKLKEEGIDLDSGYLIIPTSKNKKPVLVPLLDEDVWLIQGLPRGMPKLHFFRHTVWAGCPAGTPFGKRSLYEWWMQACRNLEIEGVDLYRGTRHSSARALREYRTPEEIRRATAHRTNKAFERYFQIEADDMREIYKDTTHKQEKKEPAEVYEFRKVE